MIFKASLTHMTLLVISLALRSMIQRCLRRLCDRLRESVSGRANHNCNGLGLAALHFEEAKLFNLTPLNNVILYFCSTFSEDTL